MKAARHCAFDITVLGAPVGYRPIGGDWWSDLAMAVLVCVWILFPQASGDKLALWRDVGLGRKRGAFGRASRPRRDRTRRGPHRAPRPACRPEPSRPRSRPAVAGEPQPAPRES